MVAGQRGNFVLTGEEAAIGIPAPYPFQERAEGRPACRNAGSEPPHCPLLPVGYRQELEVLATERWDEEM